MQEWNLADAKNRFSELVNLALTEGPQKVRRRKDQVVVLAFSEYERLRGTSPSFKKYLMEGPDLSELSLERDPSASREVKL